MASQRPEPNDLSILPVGSVLAGRYELLEILGQGPATVSYKARDRELDRVLALKVLKPSFAAQPQFVQEFRHEVNLARQVTHRNALRIFDMGHAGGLTFITMELAEARDLASLMEERSLGTAEATNVVKQICAALDAAHAEGVTHRRLTPRNVLVDESGRVWVSDFGMATAAESPTKSSEYVAPELAGGANADARTDIYAAGAILHKLAPGDAQTAAIAKKALEADPTARYENAAAMLAALEALTPAAPAPQTTRPLNIRRLAVTALIAVAAMFAVAAVAWRFGQRAPQPPHKPVTVLVADFTNTTGDPLLEGTLEPMFNIAFEGAGFIISYNRTAARRLAAQLDRSAGKLDEATCRLVAVREGINVIVAGTLARRDNSYEMSVRAIDAVTGRPIGQAQGTAREKESLVAQVPKLAAPIRRALGDATPDSEQLFALETFTAGSIEAVHEYAGALELFYNGKFQESAPGFLKAAQLDPNFGRAYASAAVAYRNVGRRDEAVKYFKLAMVHIHRMTERERYRTRGSYYGMIGDPQKCVEEFSALVKQYPSDYAGHNNLALCSTQLRKFPEAVEEMRRAVEISPKYALLRNNLALYASYAGDFAMGGREAQLVQQLNPNYEKAYLARAFAYLGENKTAEAAEVYRKLSGVSPRGVLLARLGLADIAVYEGRLDDAANLLQFGPPLTPDGFAALAYVEALRKRKPAAVAAAGKALAASKEPKIRLMAALLLIRMGETARARELGAGLAAEFESEPRLYAVLIEGEAALREGNTQRAIQHITQANASLDTWLGRFLLGRAYLAAGDFAAAEAALELCIKRRGEALSLFLDEIPTYAYLPPVREYLARAKQRVKTTAAIP